MDAWSTVSFVFRRKLRDFLSEASCCVKINKSEILSTSA
jgi:hypothetical protein